MTKINWVCGPLSFCLKVVSFIADAVVIYVAHCDRVEMSAAAKPQTLKSISENEAHITPNTVGINVTYTMGLYCSPKNVTLINVVQTLNTHIYTCLLYKVYIFRK